MISALSNLPPTVLVIDISSGPGSASPRGLAGAGDAVASAPTAVQNTGANIPPPILYDRLGRTVFEITDRHGTFTNALTLGYRWLV
jgi:hypothetical protein